MALVTYELAIAHLRQQGVLDGSPNDVDVTAKIEQATAYVVVYLQRPGEWDVNSLAEDDPEFAIVQALVLRMLGWLYRYRGDDEKAPDVDSILNTTSAGMLKDRVIA